MSDQTRDPWKRVHRFDPVLEYDGQVIHHRSICGMWMPYSEVERARAADAQTIATLQDENARLKAELDRGRRGDA